MVYLGRVYFLALVDLVDQGGGLQDPPVSEFEYSFTGWTGTDYSECLEGLVLGLVDLGRLLDLKDLVYLGDLAAYLG